MHDVPGIFPVKESSEGPFNQPAAQPTRDAIEFHFMYSDGGTPKSKHHIEVYLDALPPLDTELLFSRDELQGVAATDQPIETWVVREVEYSLQKLPDGKYRLHPEVRMWPRGQIPPTAG